MGLKQEQLKANYQKMLVGSAAIVPQASLTGEIGQINSIYTDTKFGISQGISFPTVYSRQKALMNKEWESSLLNVAVREGLLKKQVAQLYGQMLYLEEKKRIVKNADSLYQAFFKRAELRLAKGESNVLEKTSAEAQLGQIQIQLNQLQQDSAILQVQFQLLLNTVNYYVPQSGVQKLELKSIPDSTGIQEHPALKIILQQQDLANSQFLVEKSKLLPELSIGYSNASFKGVGADEKYYTGSRRFSAVTLGVGIPIFAGAQHARINSAKISKQVAERNYAMGMKTMAADYAVAVNQYKKHLQTVKYFEESSLKNAQLIESTAQLQLNNGTINYLEWVQVVNLATMIRSDYVEAIRNLNESVILLNYFSNN
jgi:cobalt-zinc-cadmium resistance protein CzcA